jgi:hypothetical protein
MSNPVIVKSVLGNAITSSAEGHVIAVANDVYDEDLELYQKEINQKVIDLESKASDITPIPEDKISELFPENT